MKTVKVVAAVIEKEWTKTNICDSKGIRRI